MDITDSLDLPPFTVVRALPTDPTKQAIVNPLLPFVTPDNIRAQVARLSNYPTRYYTSATGREAALYLLSQYELYKGSRTDIEVERFDHTWLQPSVIARIHGEGPNANERVIIGGHLDSTSRDAQAPGADDDASGSAGVLEVFRILATQGFKPSRTLEFHGYSAEEVGLRGSQAIAQKYQSDGVEVYAMLQLDMIGYIATGTVPTIGVVTDFVNAPLTAFVRKLATEYTTTRWVNTQCGYACSDHGSWTRAGYPASFPFESTFSNSNPLIHTRNDLLQYLNFDHAAEFARLAVGFAVELSLAD